MRNPSRTSLKRCRNLSRQLGNGGTAEATGSEPLDRVARHVSVNLNGIKMNTDGPMRDGVADFGNRRANLHGVSQAAGAKSRKFFLQMVERRGARAPKRGREVPHVWKESAIEPANQCEP